MLISVVLLTTVICAWLPNASTMLLILLVLTANIAGLLIWQAGAVPLLRLLAAVLLSGVVSSLPLEAAALWQAAFAAFTVP